MRLGDIVECSTIGACSLGQAFKVLIFFCELYITFHVGNHRGSVMRRLTSLETRLYAAVET